MVKANLRGSILQGTNFKDATTDGLHSTWEAKTTESRDYARDMHRLAQEEQRLSEAEADLATLDIPGKRNSLSVKLVKSNIENNKKRIAGLRFEWRVLLAADRDRDNPSEIASRVGATLPPQKSLTGKFKRAHGPFLRDFGNPKKRPSQ